MMQIRRAATLLTPLVFVALMPQAAMAAAMSVEYVSAPTPQLLVQQPGGGIVMTVLEEGLLHVSYSGKPASGTPYFSPMVAQRSFGGPAQQKWDAPTQRLQAGGLLIEPSAECWQVSDTSDTRAATSRLLARFCPSLWTARRLKLNWQSGGHVEVFGLGQHLSPNPLSPSWSGSARHSGNPMGNAMTYSSIAASGNTQVPVAYVMGEAGSNYGVFFDSPHALQMGFVRQPWQVEVNDGELGLFIFTGQDLKTLRSRYMQLTGRPPVPPLKAFGLWLSEYGYDNWGELDDKLATLREHGFPIDGAVLDLQWFGGILNGEENTAMGRLRWDTTAFPEPAARVAAYGRQGLGLMLIEESYIGKGLPEHEQMAAERLLAMSCPPPCVDAVLLDSNPWWGVGGMVDWSNPAAGRWWHDSKRRALIDDGMLGHWTDLGEPEQYDEQAHYHGYDWHGRQVTRHRDVHNLYNFFWSRSIAEESARTHPQRRPWILSRSGTAGSQRYGVAMWSGDVASSFDALGAQMRAQSNMSLSGFDYYGSDVGGFQRQGIGKKALDTLYTRWFASSTLLDVPLRPHVMNLCNCTETAPDRVGDRASNLAALRLRYQLTPYLYSLAHAAYREGEAMFPPLAYHFPEDKKGREVVNTKMMGPWLLFTPPVIEGDSVDVYLPPGRWTDFHHGERVLDSSLGKVRMPLMDGTLLRTPLFLRQGAIVPMLKQAPAHLGSPVAGGVNWFSNLLIRLVPTEKISRFVLVEDDGVTRAYENGALSRTTLELQQLGPRSFRFTLTPDNHTGETTQRTLTLEMLVGDLKPRLVQLNGKPLPRIKVGADGAGWYASPGGLTLHLGEHAVDKKLELTLLQ